MSTTQKYGYPEKLEVTAFTMIERDIQRIEKKADKALGFEADIIRSQKDIECFSKCRPNGCTQCEINEMLEGKVDKKEGYSLIPESYLQQIEELKDAVALQKEYINELREYNAWLGLELEKKANTYTSPEQLGINDDSFSTEDLDANIALILAQMKMGERIFFYLYDTSFPNLRDSIRTYLGITNSYLALELLRGHSPKSPNPIYIYPNGNGIETKPIYHASYDNRLTPACTLAFQEDIDAVIKRVEDSTEQNKESIALLETYISELRERNNWLETELANKANQKGTYPELDAGRWDGEVIYRSFESLGLESPCNTIDIIEKIIEIPHFNVTARFTVNVSTLLDFPLIGHGSGSIEIVKINGLAIHALFTDRGSGRIALGRGVYDYANKSYTWEGWSNITNGDLILPLANNEKDINASY